MSPKRRGQFHSFTPLVLASALCLLSSGITNRAVSADEKRAAPNIVLILADDLGYGELGCYGEKKYETPNIDRLAAQGLRFTRCYAGCSVCAPSRSTLMTGLHTGHTPVRVNPGDAALADADVTVAEVLKKAGYKTGCFGKWGLGVENSTGHPNRQGFDQFFGYLHQVHAHFYYPYFLWKNEKKFSLSENIGGKRGRYAHDEIMDQALKFIRASKEGPFFCYLPVTIPHVELVVPEDSMKRFADRWQETPLPDPRKGYIGAEKPYATFAGMVHRLDRDVGRIMDLLDELKIDDNTIVIFTSDNGGQGGPWQRMTDFFDGNGGLRGYKGQFYEGGIRVPFIARWPGKIRANVTTDHLCAFWDVMPTLADLAGTETPRNLDGISFAPTLRARGEQKEHDYLYWELGNARAMRLDNWKVIQPGLNKPFQVFDLKVDPRERTDLAGAQFTLLRKVKLLMDGARSEPREFPRGPRRGVKDYVK